MPSTPTCQVPMSHILWADDLILLALNAESLQKQLNWLYQFVSKWELQVNINKTNIMVINSGSKLPQCSYGFRLCGLEISPTLSYRYLGIMFSLNGSFKLAIDELRKKALWVTLRCKAIRGHILGVGAASLGLGGVWLLQLPNHTQPKTYLRVHISLDKSKGHTMHGYIAGLFLHQ